MENCVAIPVPQKTINLANWKNKCSVITYNIISNFKLKECHLYRANIIQNSKSVTWVIFYQKFPSLEAEFFSDHRLLTGSVSCEKQRLNSGLRPKVGKRNFNWQVQCLHFILVSVFKGSNAPFRHISVVFEESDTLFKVSLHF